jgi:hypothetical protein
MLIIVNFSYIIDLPNIHPPKVIKMISTKRARATVLYWDGAGA